MLSAPWLQRLPIINYESNLNAIGLHEIFDFLDQTRNLDGDIIECGSCWCGTSILMAKHMRSLGSQKTVHALDSYEGFNTEELRRERSLGLISCPDHTFRYAGMYEYVVGKIRKSGFGEMVVPLKGFFEQTLPTLASDRSFCFAFVDCDLRDSMTYCAELVWPKLVPGGIIAFDDYTATEYGGARLAVDDFVSLHETDILEHGLLRRLYYIKKPFFGPNSAQLPSCSNGPRP